MKIGVCIKEVADTATKIVISDDGQSIDKTNIKHIINPYDEFALEEALRKKDQDQSVEVITFTVGPKRASETIRKALAMGADRAVFVDDDGIGFNETFMVATLLSKMITAESVDMVFLGKQAVDDDCYQVGPMLAGLLDWPQALNVIALQFEGDRVVATREVEGGRREILALQRPCVVGVTKGINEPRYAALKGIMAAKKKEIKTLLHSDLGVDLGTLQTFHIDAMALPPERGEVKIIEGEPAEQAATLVRLLREEAKVI